MKRKLYAVSILLVISLFFNILIGGLCYSIKRNDKCPEYNAHGALSYTVKRSIVAQADVYYFLAFLLKDSDDPTLAATYIDAISTYILNSQPMVVINMVLDDNDPLHELIMRIFETQFIASKNIQSLNQEQCIELAELYKKLELALYDPYNNKNLCRIIENGQWNSMEGQQHINDVNALLDQFNRFFP